VGDTCFVFQFRDIYSMIINRAVLNILFAPNIVRTEYE